MLYLKDKLIASVAKELDMDEDIVDKVVSWSYKQIHNVCLTKSQIEIPGFGKLLVSPSKLRRMYERALDIQRHTPITNVKMYESICREVDFLKTKLDQYDAKFCTNLGRAQESSVSQ